MSFERASRTKIRTRPNARRHAGKCCPYCGVQMVRYAANIGVRPTRDHSVPLGRGGLNVVENIKIVCYDCNQQKGMLLPDEFIAWREGRASRLDKEDTNGRDLRVRSAGNYRIEYARGCVRRYHTEAPVHRA